MDYTNEDIETYKNKQKELEEKVNPLMQKFYSSQMPSGPPPDMNAGENPGENNADDLD